MSGKKHKCLNREVDLDLYLVVDVTGGVDISF